MYFLKVISSSRHAADFTTSGRHRADVIVNIGSVEVSVIAKAKESKTAEVQNQAHADRVLRCERNRPHGVLATGSDNQPACL